MTDTPWTWEDDVIRPLHRRGMTLTALAEIHGKTTSLLTSLKTRSHAPSEKIVAEFLGKPVEEVFRDRYPKRTSRVLDSKVVAKEKARKAATEQAAA